MLTTRDSITSLDLKSLFNDDYAKTILLEILQTALQDRILLVGLSNRDIANFTMNYYQQYLCNLLKEKLPGFKDNITYRHANSIRKKIAKIICEQMNALTQTDIAEIHNMLARKAATSFNLMNWYLRLNSQAEHAKHLVKEARSSAVMQLRVHHTWQEYQDHLLKTGVIQLLVFGMTYVSGAEMIVFINALSGLKIENPRHTPYVWLALFMVGVIGAMMLANRTQFFCHHLPFLKTQPLEIYLLRSAQKVLKTKPPLLKENFATELLSQLTFVEAAPATPVPSLEQSLTPLQNPCGSPKRWRMASGPILSPLQLNSTLQQRRNSISEIKEPVQDTQGSYFLKLSNGSFFRLNSAEVNPKAGTKAKRNLNHIGEENTLSSRLLSIWRKTEGQVRAPHTKEECIKQLGKHERIGNKEIDSRQHLKVRLDSSPFSSLRVILQKRPATAAEISLLDTEAPLEIYSPKKYQHK